MSPLQITAIGVRLFAVWVFAVAVLRIPLAYQLASTPGSPVFLALFLFGVLAVALLLLGLWRFPLTVAQKLIAASPPGQAEPRGNDAWLAMGCALIGLWLFAEGLFELHRSLMFTQTSYPNSSSWSLGYWLIYYGPKFAISIWLILGAKGFRKLFWWVQHAGQPGQKH